MLKIRLVDVHRVFPKSTICFQEIELGLSQMVLVGGTENMTQAPYAVRDIRFGTRFGQDLKVGDKIDLK